jgi:hypothetical protein
MVIILLGNLYEKLAYKLTEWGKFWYHNYDKIITGYRIYLFMIYF